VDCDAGSERFDQVVLACHSDQALRLLDDASDAEREVLGAIRYQANDTVLHTDARLLPRNRKAWAAWNAHVPRGSGAGRAP
jgi:predicted NAD/FAD-binding protein